MTIKTQKALLRYKHVREYALHRFVCDASDIGLRPGQRPPAEIWTEIGNGCPFMARTAYTNADGDVTNWTYIQQYGCISLTIFND